MATRSDSSPTTAQERETTMTDSSPAGTMPQTQTVAMLTSTQRLLRIRTRSFLLYPASPPEWSALLVMYDRALTDALALIRCLSPDLAADTKTEEP